MISNISWIKETIINQYPGIIADKGADLNRDGVLEPLLDVNSNGRIDDEDDFRNFLETNRQLIINNIPLLAWGSEIPVENILHTLMAIELLATGAESVSKTYKLITKIIKRFEEEKDIFNNLEPKDKLFFAYKLLVQEFHFDLEGGRLFSLDLANDPPGLDCDTASFLFLILGQYFNWPLALVGAPKHAFVRWQDDQTVFNFDLGGFYLDEDYVKDYNIAEKSIETGVYLKSLSPEEVVGVFCDNRGIAFFELGEYGQALEDFSRAISLYPNMAEAYLNRGITYNLHLNNFPAAITDLTKAIELDPNMAQAYYNRGLAYHQLGQEEEAIKDYDLALAKKHEEPAEIFYNRGISRYKLGKYQEAIEDFSRYIEANPEDAAGYYQRGEAYTILNDFEKAAADFTCAIEYQPDDAVTYVKRSYIYYKMNRFQEALSDIKQASELDSTYKPAAEQLEEEWLNK